MTSEIDPSPGSRSGAPQALKRFVRSRTRAGNNSGEVLQRIGSRPRQEAPGEKCEMCGEAIGEDHSHVVNLDNRSLMCSCRGCYLLFTHEGASRGKFRAVPNRYIYDPRFELHQDQWEALQIPVGLAFLFFNSAMKKFVAFYPSPAGATESLLDLQAWADVMEANPGFADVTPDVEALLLHNSNAGFECFLTPIDSCYELVGRVKLNWKGFDGGSEVWDDIDAFLTSLRERSRVLSDGRQRE